MNEASNNQKKGFITEEGISTLLQRYTATTILALLQEVAQASEVKIDWNSLVQKTATGISNAREYQILWRHLAYGHNLVEKLENGAEPMDDDSDLDYELEVFPPLGAEASTEAAACVKVLIGSGLSNEPSIPNNATVEAPLTINIPNGQSARASLENTLPTPSKHGTNITVPVSVKKQSVPPVTSGEGAEINGLASSIHPNRKKRKPWSELEDLELIAAVQKCGEGNWANILKGDFKGDRTASQLAQRWTIIRKRQSSLNVGANSSGSQLSEAQLATRRAIDMALKDNVTAPSAGNSAVAGTSNPGVLNTSNEDSQAVNSTSQSQNSPHQAVNTASKTATLCLTAKPRPPGKKVPTKTTISPDSMVKAAAVAAGARIASPSDAATLFKAAQAKNAVHIMPVVGGGSMIKPPGAGSGNPLPSTHLPGHPNVHYFRTGLVATTSSPMAAGSHQVRGNAVRSAVPLAAPPQSAKTAAALTPTLPQQQTAAAATSSPATEHQGRQETESAESIKVPSSNTKSQIGVREDLSSVSDHPSGEQLDKDQSMLLLPKKEAVGGNQSLANSQSLQGTEKAEENKREVNKVVKNKAENGTIEKAVRSGEQSTNRTQEVFPNMAEKLEVASEAVPEGKTIDQKGQ